MAIAAAVTLPFNPAVLPVSLLGSTAPDWLEWIGKFFGMHIEHRKQTHYLVVPVAILLLSAFIDYRSILFWFGIGYFTHWIADSVTITGVPLSPWDTRKIHFFGGSLRTGDAMEYVYSFGLLAASVFVFMPAAGDIMSFFNTTSTPDEFSFNAYSMQYRELYDQKIIDAKELVEHRFKFF